MIPFHLVHVEDDQPLRDILKVAFQAIEPQINLHQFHDSEDVIPYILQYGQSVDLFVLDICLPGRVNGVALARKIRDLNCPGHIVLTSAYTSPREETLVALTSQYFPKPWNILDMSRRLLTYRLDANIH